jgi:hypothetical protein
MTRLPRRQRGNEEVDEATLSEALGAIVMMLIANGLRLPDTPRENQGETRAEKGCRPAHVEKK